MLGLGPHAICILLDLKTAFTDLSIVIPLVQDLAGCISAEEVKNIPAPEESCLVGFKESAHFIPNPVFQNIILMSYTKNLFDLIPIILIEIKCFDIHKFQSTAAHHADNLNAWLYGMKIGLVPKTRYSVNPNDTEIVKFCGDRHLQYITLNTATAAGNTTGALVINSASVISELINAISLKNEQAMESNSLCPNEIERQVECKEKKKNKTNDLYPAIMNMLLCAAATHSNNKREEIAPTYQRFINAKNISLAQR
jgi:hypothetical protein